MTWKEAVKRWRVLLAVQSRATATTQAKVVSLFFRYVAADLDGLTRDHLERWRVHLASRTFEHSAGRRLALSSTVKYEQYVKVFLRDFCMERDLLPKLTAREIEQALPQRRMHVETPYEVLDSDEISRVLAMADERAQAMIALGLFAGLRISEIVALKAEHIVHDETSCYVRVVQGKGSKDRKVPVHAGIYELLKDYMGGRPGWLFPGPTADHLSATRARDIIKNVILAAGIKRRITPHSLRHTYAHRLSEARTPVAAISKLLGHTSLQPTMRYVDHYDLQELAQYAPGL